MWKGAGDAEALSMTAGEAHEEWVITPQAFRPSHMS